MALRRKAHWDHRHQNSVRHTHRGRELHEDQKDLQLGLNRQNCELRSTLAALQAAFLFVAPRKNISALLPPARCLRECLVTMKSESWGISAGTSFHFALLCLARSEPHRDAVHQAASRNCANAAEHTCLRRRVRRKLLCSPDRPRRRNYFGSARYGRNAQQPARRLLACSAS